jgi:hypothetical protein
MKIIKLNTLLGLREKVEAGFRGALDDMLQKFKKNQGLFKGERKTYVAADGYADEPTKRTFKRVQSTVKEQLDWLEESSKDFMDIVFSIEKTNATGKVKAELIVAGENWGEFSSLELLRLKTTLENSKLKSLYPILAIRTSTESWKISDDAEYEGQDGLYQTDVSGGSSKTTLKESYILKDPHMEPGGTTNRPPIIAERNTQAEIGTYTVQNFSGEMSALERANILVRYNELMKAVIIALQEANNVASETSVLGTKVFKFLHNS